MPARHLLRAGQLVGDLAAGLRALLGSADAFWYDGHNLGSGALLTEIQHHLHARPIFVIALSRAALYRPLTLRRSLGRPATTLAAPAAQRQPHRADNLAACTPFYQLPQGLVDRVWRDPQLGNVSLHLRWGLSRATAL